MTDNERGVRQITYREPVEITLGTGAESEVFRIAPQTKRSSAHFRQKIGEALAEMTVLRNLVGTIESAFSKDKELDLKDLPWDEVALGIQTIAVTAPDAFLDLVYEYDPSWAERREWIDDHALVDQLIEALVEMFRMAFGPFVSRLPLSLEAVTGIANDAGESVKKKQNGSRSTNTGKSK